MLQSNAAFTEADTEITKIQELMYELRVNELMTRPVISMRPYSTMVEAKELMRSRRISGLPVTDQERVVGIVSVEDIIRWLENGNGDSVVATWMTTRVIAVRANEPAALAINKFGTYHVGRLPVLDQDGRLVGIVTPGDIVERVVRVLDTLYREAEPHFRHERPVSDEMASEHTTIILRYTVPPLDFDNTGAAATGIKRLLDALRVEPQIVRRAGIAVYEAEMNLTIHATHGGRIVARVEPETLEVVVTDDGPGIADVAQALSPGYSTAPDWIRELGFGAGMGLNNIRSCADRFSIESEAGKGTRLLIRLALGSRNPSALRV